MIFLASPHGHVDDSAMGSFRRGAHHRIRSGYAPRTRPALGLLADYGVFMDTKCRSKHNRTIMGIRKHSRTIGACQPEANGIRAFGATRRTRVSPSLVQGSKVKQGEGCFRLAPALAAGENEAATDSEGQRDRARSVCPRKIRGLVLCAVSRYSRKSSLRRQPPPRRRH